MAKAEVLGCVLLMVLVGQGSCDLGNGLFRTFNLALLGVEAGIPTDVQTAVAGGWAEVGSGRACDPYRGFRYAPSGSVAPLSGPLSVWFTAGGQVSGLSVNVFGVQAPDYLVERGLWERTSESDEWTLSVAFRDSEGMCDPDYVYGELLGDRLVVNPDTVAVSLPTTEEDAICEGWIEGSGMSTMGYHYFNHLDQDNLWDYSRLFPVVLMFDGDGDLQAFFFTFPAPQVTYPPPTTELLDEFWEGTPLPPVNMCQNWCDDECEWPGVVAWQTMHIYVNSNYLTLVLPGRDDSVVGRVCRTEEQVAYCAGGALHLSSLFLSAALALLLL
mmetsp:Transcript_10373/g.29132  ORF Transcript_10373/g.29132 Transcript_10373/m.29132 type:complete len:328 (-) Transcript_10373:102-1085(-)